LPYNKPVNPKPHSKENKMAYTLKSTVGDILKDTDLIVKVLEKYAPMIGAVKGMSLESLLAFPQVKQVGITKEMVLKVMAEVNARK
jgi:hypothetical protein